MSGPTRFATMERRRDSDSARRARSSGRAYELGDELDQFVDSEPAGWSSRRAGPHRLRNAIDQAMQWDEAHRGEDGDASAADPDGASASRDDIAHGASTDTPAEAGADGGQESAPGARANAAFSTAGASTRQNAFTKRLQEELSKPQASEPPAGKGARREAAATAARPSVAERPEPKPSTAAPAAPVAEQPREALAPDAARDRGGAPGSGTDRNVESVEAAPDRDERRPARSRATPTLLAPAFGGGALAEGKTGAGAAEAPSKSPAKTKAAPADALDWDLDNAIGAVVASGRRGSGEEAASEPSADEREADPHAAVVADVDAAGQTAEDPPDDLDSLVQSSSDTLSELSPDDEDRAPARDADDGEPPAEEAVVPPKRRGLMRLDTRQLRPVPTFRFDRKPRASETEPSPYADADDPLEHVFFKDAREAFGGVRDGERPLAEEDGSERAFGAPFGEGEGPRLSELDDPLARADDPLDDDSDLPPSLKRGVARSRGRPTARVAGIALAVVALAVIAVGGVVVVNVFAGDDDATVPVVRADAQDYKVRAEDDGPTAEPAIDERVALDESDRLVVPQTVRVAPSSVTPSDADALGPTTRQVHTVEVRPDGTIVPTRTASTGAASQDEEASATRSSDETSRNAAVSDPGRDATDSSAETQSVAANVIVVPGEITGDGVAASSDGATDEPAPATVERARPEPVETARSAEPSPARGVEPTSGSEDAGDVLSFAATPRSFIPTDDVTDLTAAVPNAADNAASTNAAVRVPRRRPAVPTRVRTASADAAAINRSGVPGVRTDAQPESAVPAVVPAATATTPPASKPWGVQLASQRNEADARQSYRDLAGRYASILSGREPLIYRANVPGRGAFYRVRIATETRGEANGLCQRLKAAGADCYVGRN